MSVRNIDFIYVFQFSLTLIMISLHQGPEGKQGSPGKRGRHGKKVKYNLRLTIRLMTDKNNETAPASATWAVVFGQESVVSFCIPESQTRDMKCLRETTVTFKHSPLRRHHCVDLYQGDHGLAGQPGEMGSAGETGHEGERGLKGARGTRGPPVST